MNYSYTDANLRLSTATSFREFFTLELWCEITSRFSEILVVTEREVSGNHSWAFLLNRGRTDLDTSRQTPKVNKRQDVTYLYFCRPFFIFLFFTWALIHVRIWSCEWLRLVWFQRIFAVTTFKLNFETVVLSP